MESAQNLYLLIGGSFIRNYLIFIQRISANQGLFDKIPSRSIKSIMSVCGVRERNVCNIVD